MWVESKVTTSFNVTVAKNSDMHKYLRDELVNNDFSDGDSIFNAIEFAHLNWWSAYKKAVLFEIERRWNEIWELDLKKVATELLEEWEERYAQGLEVSIWESVSSHPEISKEVMDNLTYFNDKLNRGLRI